MMQKKKRTSLVVYLAALTTSLYIPFTVNAAAPPLDTSSGIVHIEDYDAANKTYDCRTRCEEHVITSSNTDPAQNQTIVISGGPLTNAAREYDHIVTLRNVHIKAGETDGPALSIRNKTKVKLILEGVNTLESTGGSNAGLFVEAGSSVVIECKNKDDADSLTATGGTGGAGIGGQGSEPQGSITIKSGTINATGGKSAAGIGGGDFGPIGNITITGGKITAQGGEGSFDTAGIRTYKSGAGIGYGGEAAHDYALNSDEADDFAKVILSGGEITAYGGADIVGQGTVYGIDCPVLKSQNGSTEITGSLAPKTYKKAFNGIVWASPYTSGIKREGYIYGKACLTKDIQQEELLRFYDNTGSLLITPPEPRKVLHNYGGISGTKSNSIINRHLLQNSTPAGSDRRGSISGPVSTKVILIADDLKKSSDLNLKYTGASLTAAAFQLINEDGTRDVTVEGKKESVEIDDLEHWSKTAYSVHDQQTPLTDGIVDAGSYILKCTNPNYPASASFTLNIEVAARDIKECKISDIDSPVYNGKEQKPEVTVSYEDKTTHEVTEIPSDNYKAKADSWENNINASDKSPATFTLAGQNNLTGSVDLSFFITAVPIDGDNTSITLKGEKGDTIDNPENNRFTAVYKSEDYSLTESVTVTTDSSAETLKPDKDYTVTRPDDTPHDADTYTYTIKGTGNYKGEKTAVFEITPKQIAIKEEDLQTETSKFYDANSYIGLKQLTLTGVLKDEVWADLEKTKAIICNTDGTYATAASAAPYTTVVLDPLKLSGPENKLKNYSFNKYLEKFEDKKPRITVKEGITIEKAGAVSPELIAVIGDENNKFTCTLTIKKPENPVYEGLTYEYRYRPADQTPEESTGEDGWISVPVSGDSSFVTIKNLDKGNYIFEARSLATGNVSESAFGGTVPTKITAIDLLDEPGRPEGFQLKSDGDDVENPDRESFTLTLIPPEGWDPTRALQYCIVEESEDLDESALPYEDYQIFESNMPNPNKKTDCEASTSYAAFVRYAQTDTRKPGKSEVSEALKVTTGDLYVAMPEISFYEEADTENTENSSVILNDREFIGSAKIQITCDTPGAKIYYTLDGSEPTKDSVPYEGPFTLSRHKKENLVQTEGELDRKETTVKAVAIRPKWKDGNAESVFSRQLSQLPELTLTLSSPADKDPYSFVNSTTVTIECKTDSDNKDKPKIYYTMAAGETVPEDPATDGNLYQGPFPIKETVTIKAIAVQDDMTSRIMEPATLTQIILTPKLNYSRRPKLFARTGEETAGNHITPLLEDTIKNRMKEEDHIPAASREEVSDKIGQLLYNRLDVLGNYTVFTEKTVQYYDFIVMATVGYEEPTPATASDFPEEGYTFTIAYPDGTSMEANDFALVHMFEEGEAVGKIEERIGKDITKTPKGLQFTLSSASPIAVAWTAAEEDGPYSNNIGDGENGGDPGTDSKPEPDPSPDPEPAPGSDPNPDPGAGPGNNSRDGSDTDSGSGSGSTNGGGNTSSAADAVRSAAASLLPKTGDNSGIVIWIILAAACTAVIAVVKLKKP